MARNSYQECRASIRLQGTVNDNRTVGIRLHVLRDRRQSYYSRYSLPSYCCLRQRRGYHNDLCMTVRRLDSNGMNESYGLKSNRKVGGGVHNGVLELKGIVLGSLPAVRSSMVISISNPAGPITTSI